MLCDFFTFFLVDFEWLHFSAMVQLVQLPRKKSVRKIFFYFSVHDFVRLSGNFT